MNNPKFPFAEWKEHVTYDSNITKVTLTVKPNKRVVTFTPLAAAVVVVDGKQFDLTPYNTLELTFTGREEDFMAKTPEEPTKKKGLPYGMTNIDLPPLPDEPEVVETPFAVVPAAAAGAVETPLPAKLVDCEQLLFSKREQVEVLWLDIGKLCAHIARGKLYKQAKDEHGNYFRTANSYFQDLDRRFHERGLNVGRTTMHRFMADYKLFIEGESGVALTPEEAVTVGKSNLEALAPAVRKLQREGKKEEAATLVRDVVDAALANGGLPTSEVNTAVDEYTDRVMKGMEAQFKDGLFGKKLDKLVLWWGGNPIDILKAELTEEQAAWVLRRLGVKQGNLT